MVAHLIVSSFCVKRTAKAFLLASAASSTLAVVVAKVLILQAVYVLALLAYFLALVAILSIYDAGNS